jgi:phosphohistidine phosphatase
MAVASLAGSAPQAFNLGVVDCYFLRHGIAVDAAQWSGSDFDRPLTDQGRQRMEREARAIAQLGLDLDLIVSSPLVRAKETATIVAARLKMEDRLVEEPRLAESFDAARLSGILSDHAGADAVLLVGHEPTMSATIAQLTGGSVDLKKGGLARVELADAASMRGVLLWLLPPKILATFEKR